MSLSRLGILFTRKVKGSWRDISISIMINRFKFPIQLVKSMQTDFFLALYIIKTHNLWSLNNACCNVIFGGSFFFYYFDNMNCDDLEESKKIYVISCKLNIEFCLFSIITTSCRQSLFCQLYRKHSIWSLSQICKVNNKVCECSWI